MKKYLIAESYGLGDKLYTDAIVKELLRLPDTEKVAMIVSKAGGNLKISLIFMCCSHMAVKSDIVRWILQDWQQQDLII